jgi:Fe-S cluster assembly protein SufD
LSTTASAIDVYRELFREFELRATGRELSWLRKLRREAFARFQQQGFPTTHDEDWRFTSVASIAHTTFRLSRAGEVKVSPEQLRAWQWKGAGTQLVFVNGHYAPELSSQVTQPAGVEIRSLAEALESSHHGHGVPAQHLGRWADSQRDSFCALNTAFAEDGACIHVARRAVVEAPISLLFLTVPSGQAAMCHPRNLIVVEEQGQVAVVEEYLALDSASGESPDVVRAFSNAVTELAAGSQAVVSHCRIEHSQPGVSNLSTLRLEQARGAAVASHALLLGGALVRNNVHAVLAGEGCDCLINGLFVGRGAEHVDNFMLVEHASPHCASRQFYNGLLDGHARGVYHGRIVVHPDAQKTDAKQTNRNLLLSDDAQIDTKPQLEIHADDVKCTHGATIGQLDEEALFYLRSRGIAEDAARRLLLLAFAGEALERIRQDAVRSHAARLVRQTVLHMTGETPGAEGTGGDELSYEDSADA